MKRVKVFLMTVWQLSRMVQRGSLSLLALAFVISMVAGTVTLPIAGDTATAPFVALMAGTLSTMGLRNLGNLVGLSLSGSDLPGILGTYAAVVVLLILA